MSEHHHHDHGEHSHGSHGPVVHGPLPGAQVAYNAAFDAAVPDEAHRVVEVDIEAREIDWEFIPGRRTRAWGFNGQVPGPTVEARVGDVLEVRLTNHLPSRS